MLALREAYTWVFMDSHNTCFGVLTRATAYEGYRIPDFHLTD